MSDAGWRPIDSAPRDGTLVDLWVGGPFSRRRPDCFWHAQPGDDPHWRQRYAENTISSFEVVDVELADAEPTHWRPRPAAPDPADGVVFLVFVQTNDQTDRSYLAGVFSSREEADRALTTLRRARTWVEERCLDQVAKP